MTSQPNPFDNVVLMPDPFMVGEAETFDQMCENVAYGIDQSKMMHEVAARAHADTIRKAAIEQNRSIR